MLAIVLLVFGIISRFIVHIPNFTPVLSIALFSGAYLDKRYAIWLPVVLMILSDLVLGLHETILFTWSSMALICLLGFSLREERTPLKIASLSLASAIQFFIITNFGVWLVSHLYPMTWEGLKECFILAIPFFRATCASTILYCFLLFGVYEFLAFWIRKTRFASVLLTN